MKKQDLIKTLLFTIASIFIGTAAYSQCSFTGLDSEYCSDASPVTLTGETAGGVFTGAGMTGDVFDPAAAGSGNHDITYNVEINKAKYYLRPQVGEPWGSTSNTDAMDLAFGSGNWTLGILELLDPAAIFTNETGFVFIDGSDQGADELETFLTANITAIEAWVYSGGRLLMNAAPNVGGDIDFGFNGSTLVYSNASSSVDVVDLKHPAFVGPNTTVAGTMTGGSYSHAHITGNDFTSVLVNSTDATNIVVCEKAWGEGRVMMGGMTMSSFHSPLLEANNFRANLLSYMGYGKNKFYLTAQVGDPWGSTANSDAMDLAFGMGLWSRDIFETLDPLEIFSENTSVVFIDGSDDGAIELAAFLLANQSVIENWVNLGGSLLINAAPNEGGDIDLGFNGSTLIYANPSNSVTVSDLAHPAYVGPNTPTSATMTGGSYSHAHITGTGFTDVLANSNDASIVVLREKAWGEGRVMMGGMTTSNYHSPLLEANNYRANLLVHMSELYDGTFCSTTNQVTVLEPIALTYSTSDEMLGMDGSIDITVSGGLAPYSFDWDNDGTGDFDDLEDLSSLTNGSYVVTVEDDAGCLYSETITVNSQLGIDNQVKIAMKLYPNPTQGETTIEVEGNFTYVFTDLNGKVISQGAGFNKEIIDLTPLYSGVYFVKVSTNEASETHRLVKK
ncbi:MAG: T9SS type A sorting domain-containing protein [Crocinitomicaceae bacterium]|nr:T9SS type A sorting domain-containing protein [Crocinitomicaceae bacterium]